MNYRCPLLCHSHSGSPFGVRAARERERGRERDPITATRFVVVVVGGGGGGDTSHEDDDDDDVGAA